MTSTAHALVASVIAKSVPTPFGIVLSYVSHYVLDSIPHWDIGTNWRSRPKKITGIYAIAETVFGVGISYYIYGSTLQFSYWAMCVGVSLLPDWQQMPWYIFFANQKKRQPAESAGILEKISFALYNIPNRFHAKAQLPLGIITQIITVGLVIYLLL